MCPTAPGPSDAGTCSTTGPIRSPERCCACTATPPGRSCGAGSSPQPRRAGGWSRSTSWAWAGRTGCPSPGGWPSASTTSGDLTAALGIEGPVVTVAHDWGGPISVGWALRAPGPAGRAGAVQHRRPARPGHRRPGSDPAGPLRTAARDRLRPDADLRPRRRRAVPAPAAACGPRRRWPSRTPTRHRRRGDRRLRGRHPAGGGSPEPGRADRRRRGAGRADRRPGPAALGSPGPGLHRAAPGRSRARLPQADVQRYPRAAHLVTEDVPEAAEHVWRWVLDRAAADPEPAEPARELEPAALGRPAGPAGRPRRGRGRGARRAGRAPLPSPSWRPGSPTCAAGLQADGVRPGDRVALLIPPGRRPDGRGVRLLAGRRGDRGGRRGSGPARPGPRAAQRRRPTT